MKFCLKKQSPTFLWLLLLADCAFILVHGLYLMDLTSNGRFSIESNFGYAEVYQYIKEYWIVLLLFGLAVKRGQGVYLAWCSLFTYFLLDDAIGIHENGGDYLVDHYGLQSVFCLSAEDVGELIVSGAAGLLFLALIVPFYKLGNRVAKLVSKHLFILIIALAFFGVFTDMIHSAVDWGESLWGTIEDAGEMLVMSLIAWYVFELKNGSLPAPGLDDHTQ